MRAVIWLVDVDEIDMIWDQVTTITSGVAIAVEGEKNRPFGLDMSIESMSSQEFSTGIFYFLVAAIIIFVGIILLFMLKDKANKLKVGEKILFVWIFFGVVAAVGLGAAQMIHGYLF